MNRSRVTGIIALLAGMAVISCKSDIIEGTILVDDTKYETVNLEDMTTELDVYRIKADESLLIGGYEDIKIYDDYIFIKDNDSRLYCIEGDSIISVLNKSGRGHGEYHTLDYWCYSNLRKTLYVHNDESLLCYSVPDFSFTGKIDEDIYPIDAFGDDIFYSGNDEENTDSTIVKQSLYKYSLTSGQKTKIKDLSYFSSVFVDETGLFRNGDDLLITLFGRDNKILRYDKDSVPTELATIRYDSKFATPKEIEEFDMPDYEHGDFENRINDVLEFYDYLGWTGRDETRPHAYGCVLPQFGKGTLTFWHTHREPGLSTSFYTITDGTNTVNYHLTIPGLLEEIKNFMPSAMYSGYVYSVYQGNRYMFENEDEEPSSLASRIMELGGKSFNDEYLIILRARMRTSPL